MLTGPAQQAAQMVSGAVANAKALIVDLNNGKNALVGLGDTASANSVGALIDAMTAPLEALVEINQGFGSANQLQP